jgi:hypothetical protein
MGRKVNREAAKSAKRKKEKERKRSRGARL